MTPEEQAVVEAAEALVAAWNSKDGIGATNPLCEAVEALQASRPVYPTKPGWWWDDSDTPCEVEPYSGGLVIKDTYGELQYVDRFIWARDPKDPTKAHRCVRVES